VVACVEAALAVVVVVLDEEVDVDDMVAKKSLQETGRWLRKRSRGFGRGGLLDRLWYLDCLRDSEGGLWRAGLGDFWLWGCGWSGLSGVGETSAYDLDLSSRNFFDVLYADPVYARSATTRRTPRSRGSASGSTTDHQR